MPFPAHIEDVLRAYGVRADTRAALFELYLSLGDEVLAVFAGIAENADASSLGPESTAVIRASVVERYVRRNHPLWLARKPTPSLWHPRVAEGRASGAAIPFAAFPQAVQRVLGAEEHPPPGVMILGRNAHFGGRPETISFDVVAEDVEDAVALALAAGQQHTIPGSAGAASGTYDAERNLLLVWEVQPHVYKPAGDRNRAIARIFRRHRNWHLATLAAALDWGRAQGAAAFVLRGSALATAHEVNPRKPLSPAIAALHDRTVTRVAAALGLELADAEASDELPLLDSVVLNHALRQHLLRNGIEGTMWKATMKNEG